MSNVDEILYDKKVNLDATLPFLSPTAAASSASDVGSVVGTFVFPLSKLRKMAVVNAILLSICYSLLTGTCIVARTVDFDPEWEVITTWKMFNSGDARSHLDSNATVVDHLDVGDVCEVYGNADGVPNDEGIRSAFGGSRMHMVSPVNGWLTVDSSDSYDDKNNNKAVLLMEQMGVSERQIGNVCPLFGAGQTHEDEKRYHTAPGSLVVAQIIWNAVQVVHLFLLLCIAIDMATSVHRWSIRTVAVGFLTTVSVAMLPFSVYFISPGGSMYSILVLLCSLFIVRTAASSSSDELRIVLTDKESAQDPPAGRQDSFRYLGKVEHVGLLCNLGCSMYNYGGRKPSYWINMFRGLDSIMGWTSYGTSLYKTDSLDCFVPESYTLGISGVSVPLFVPRSRGSTTGHLIFLCWWSLLPFLYIIYFGLMYAMSHTAPGSKIQKGLCAWAIFHFFVLTDLVDYQYGRGYKTDPFLGGLAHWSERIVWRIALLLPVYQNVCSGKWKRGRFVILVHYFMAAWGIVFFVYQVVMNDFYKLPQFFKGVKYADYVMMFGWKYNHYVGYQGALSLMWVFYAVSLICLPVRYVFIQRLVDASTQNTPKLIEKKSSNYFTF